MWHNSCVSLFGIWPYTFTVCKTHPHCHMYLITHTHTDALCTFLRCMCWTFSRCWLSTHSRRVSIMFDFAYQCSEFIIVRRSPHPTASRPQCPGYAVFLKPSPSWLHPSAPVLHGRQWQPHWLHRHLQLRPQARVLRGASYGLQPLAPSPRRFRWQDEGDGGTGGTSTHNSPLCGQTSALFLTPLVLSRFFGRIAVPFGPQRRE